MFNKKRFAPLFVQRFLLEHLFLLTNITSTIAWKRGGFEHKTVNHSAGEYARDEDGDGFCEVHSNTMEGFWSFFEPTGLSAIGVAIGIIDEPLIVTAAPMVSNVATVTGVISGCAYFYSKWKNKRESRISV